MRPASFTEQDLKTLKTLGQCGYPAATRACREIVQMNAYAYALEAALIFGFSNSSEVAEMIEIIRDQFAPDVRFSPVDIHMLDGDGSNE